MKNYLKHWIWVLIFVLPTISYSQKLTVGEEVFIQYESPHPYESSKDPHKIVWAQKITYTEKTATYIAVHFEKFQLAIDDKLIFRSPDGNRQWEYTSADNRRDSFWSIPIYGNEAIIEIVSSSKNASYGYKIDKIARGFTQDEMVAANGPESICGNDDTEEAICYQNTEPMVYERSRAVARLWLSGTVNSTGFLLGDEGHLMTCHHAINNTNQANNTTVEMMAEGPDCATNCQTPAACPGDIVASAVTPVQFGCDLDYALVLLPNNVSQTYGFLQMRQSGPMMDEQIYIPQHPQGWGKRIAFVSDNSHDIDGFIHVQGLTENSCYCGNDPNRVGYYGDTRRGSSGSPVISYSDHCVVGIHGCGGCPNKAANSSLVINDLNYIPNNALCGPCGVGEDIHISSNTTFNTDQGMPGSIFVHAGAQLTVTAQLDFGEDKVIVVERGAKLVVDGGKLTKCWNAEDWGGIYVEGNSSLTQPNVNSMPSANEAGIVHIKNSSVIEFARNAISTTKYQEHWNSPYWGGLVHCENSEFINCKRTAEFMKYDISNNSTFINCTISNGSTGVTIWDTDGIDFNQCKFENLDESGILVWDAGCNIFNGCSFSGNTYGVQSNATSTVSSGATLVIGDTNNPNVFDDNDYIDIELRASSLYKNTRVFNNLFTGTYDFSVWLDGRNSANIRDNTFSTQFFAIAGQYMDYGATDIFCNDLSNNIEYGITMDGNNQRTKFLSNSFETQGFDFTLMGDKTSGAVHPDQQFIWGTSAANCFSSTHIEHIVTLNNTTPFNYHVLANNPPLCQVPQLATYGTNNYYVSFNGNFDPTQKCNLDLDGGPKNEGPFQYDDYKTIREEYLKLQEQLKVSPADLQLLSETLEKETEKEGIIAWFIRDAISSGKGSMAQAILNEENTTESKRLLYGLKIQLNDYAGAQSLLYTLPNKSQGEQWFRDVQEINLERLKNSATFKLSDNQNELLQKVAKSKSSERGYARALLSFLKGQQFYPDIELPKQKSMTLDLPIIPADKENNFSVTVHPNPSDGQVEVILKGEEIKDGEISIISMNGVVMKSLHLQASNRQTIQLSDLANGIYFLRITSSGKVVERTKLVVSK